MNKRQKWLGGLVAEWGELSDEKQEELSLGLAISASQHNREYPFFNHPSRTIKEDNDE